jgi:hypothetical protein
LVFTGISFAYFGGKRKEEGRFTADDTESTEEGTRIRIKRTRRTQRRETQEAA